MDNTLLESSSLSSDIYGAVCGGNSIKVSASFRCEDEHTVTNKRNTYCVERSVCLKCKEYGKIGEKNFDNPCSSCIVAAIYDEADNLERKRRDTEYYSYLARKVDQHRKITIEHNRWKRFK